MHSGKGAVGKAFVVPHCTGNAPIDARRSLRRVPAGDPGLHRLQLLPGGRDNGRGTLGNSQLLRGIGHEP